MFKENTEVDDNSAESVDDMTAAATAPIPMTEMKDGVRYCRVSGRTMVWSPRSHGEGEP